MTHETTVPAHSFLAVRETISTAAMTDWFDRTFNRLGRVLQEVGVRPAGPARAYYFSPLSDSVDIAAGFPLFPEHVAAVEAAQPELVHHLPECTVMTTRHHGSYETLGQTWQELTDHVRSSGRPTGPVFWEEYVTEPSPQADPADMVTDLYVTLA